MKRLMPLVLALGTLTLPCLARAGAPPAAPVPLPEFGTAQIPVTACTADGHVAHLQFMVSNLSPFDTNLPEGATAWATKEEMFAVAAQVYATNIPPYVTAKTDAEVEAENFISGLMQTQTTIHGQFDDSGEDKDVQVTLDLKNTLQIKMAFYEQGKYTAVAENYAPANTWAKVDRTASCKTTQ